MAVILNDIELNKMIGTVIIDGNSDCVRPNSYVLRLGNEGEFLNSGKGFTLGQSKKGLKISPGHSVAITSMETIDFRQATVQRIYPDCALLSTSKLSNGEVRFPCHAIRWKRFLAIKYLGSNSAFADSPGRIHRVLAARRVRLCRSAT